MRSLIGCFLKALGTCSTIVVECWGLLEGLKLVQSKGYQKVEIQIDSKDIYNDLLNENHKVDAGLSVLCQIRIELRKELEVWIMRVHRSQPLR